MKKLFNEISQGRKLKDTGERAEKNGKTYTKVEVWVGGKYSRTKWILGDGVK